MAGALIGAKGRVGIDTHSRPHLGAARSTALTRVRGLGAQGVAAV
jgi:hypothetical protein